MFIPTEHMGVLAPVFSALYPWILSALVPVFSALYLWILLDVFKRSEIKVAGNLFGDNGLPKNVSADDLVNRYNDGTLPDEDRHRLHFLELKGEVRIIKYVENGEWHKRAVCAGSARKRQSQVTFGGGYVV